MAKKQVSAFLLSVLFCAFSYCAIMLYSAQRTSMPTFERAEMWLKDTYVAKDNINRIKMGKRLIVIGGSSSLFGFNGAIIEANTDFSFINYGTHAGLPLNYHIDKIIANAKDGDTVILPLEFDYYFREAPIDDMWYIQNMLSWGKYYAYIDKWHSVLAHVRNNPTKTLKNNIKHLMKTFAQNEPFISPKQIAQMPKHTESYTLEEGIKILPCANEKWALYSYRSLSPNGDFCQQSGSIDFAYKSAYFDDKAVISTFFLNEWERLSHFCNAHNMRCILTFPPTVENPLFSIKDDHIFAKIAHLQSQLSAHNIHIYGDFTAVHFDKTYFYDTRYHLNDKGVKLRTISFLKQLDSILNAL